MLIMENSEEILQILERFTKLKQKDIPKELDEYLCYVAKTGDTVYRWVNIKYLFREKLMHVIKDFHDSTPGIDDLPQYPNVDPFNYETMKSALLERLELFNAAPFTVQRLCELLTDPRKQYSRIDKYMRALEKNILVVSTVEPGRKQPESENGDSLDSVVNGDISLDVNVDIELENESIFRMDTQNTSSTSASASSKPEDSSESSAKKAKIDNEESSSDKSKSGSDSDESSDDSDSQNSKEAPKDDQVTDGTKFESNNSDKSEKASESNDVVGDQKQEQNLEIVSAQQGTTCREKESDDDSHKSDENSTETSYPVETEKVSESESEGKSKEKEDSEERKEERVVNKITETENTEPHCAAESSAASSSENTCKSPENTQQNENVSETLLSEQPSEKPTETETPPSSMISEAKSPKNAESFVQRPDSEQTTSSEQKLPEQMSVEDQQIIPAEPPTPDVPIVNITVEEQATSDQPMDENLEPAISSTCAADSSCLNEVVMQSESDMATEPMKVSDDKTGPTGMDVDDTSQEEAMDQ